MWLDVPFEKASPLIGAPPDHLKVEKQSRLPTPFVPPTLIHLTTKPAHLHPPHLLSSSSHLHPDPQLPENPQTPLFHRSHLVLPGRVVPDEMGVRPVGRGCDGHLGFGGGSGRSERRQGSRMDALVGFRVSEVTEGRFHRESTVGLLIKTVILASSWPI